MSMVGVYAFTLLSACAWAVFCGRDVDGPFKDFSAGMVPCVVAGSHCAEIVDVLRVCAAPL